MEETAGRAVQCSAVQEAAAGGGGQPPARPGPARYRPRPPPRAGGARLRLAAAEGTSLRRAHPPAVSGAGQPQPRAWEGAAVGPAVPPLRAGPGERRWRGRAVFWEGGGRRKSSSWRRGSEELWRGVQHPPRAARACSRAASGEKPLGRAGPAGAPLRARGGEGALRVPGARGRVLPSLLTGLPAKAQLWLWEQGCCGTGRPGGSAAGMGAPVQLFSAGGLLGELAPRQNNQKTCLN